MARATGTAIRGPGLGPDPLMAAHMDPATVCAVAGNPVRGVAWPARAGMVPPLADAFTVRAGIVPGIEATLAPTAAIALVSGHKDGAPEGYSARLATVTGPWLSRFEAFDAVLDRRHPAGLAHHHLALLAVRPGRQGHGTGTALLGAHHTVLDRDRLPAYLEASALDTRQLYLQHGYTDHGPPIKLPDGPRMYPMIGDPHRPHDA